MKHINNQRCYEQNGLLQNYPERKTTYKTTIDNKPIVNKRTPVVMESETDDPDTPNTPNMEAELVGWQASEEDLEADLLIE